MAYADLMKGSDPETPEKEQIRLQQQEAERVNLFEGWDNTASDDLLFSPPSEAEAPADYARNTLQAYYSKELGVDSLPEMAFNQFIKEDFGEETDYDTALASLQESKRWGTTAREPTKLELAKHENLTTGDWLRSFSGNTTKAVYGIDAGLLRAAAAGAAAIGQEDSEFYRTMMGAADAAVEKGADLLDVMISDRVYSDPVSDKARDDIFAQNLGQLMVVVPLGIATGGTSWGVGLATVGTVNAGMLYNEAFEQAREDGQGDAEALKTASLYTLAAAPAETLVDLATAGIFKPFTKYAAKLAGPTRQAIVRTAIQSLTAAGPGGLVEGGQYALLNKLTNREIDEGEFWATVRAGALLEGLGGSITQVAGEVDSARAKAKLRKDFRLNTKLPQDQVNGMVDRIMGSDEPNNQLNREVLQMVSADFEAISILGRNSELRARAVKEDAEFWKQAGSEQEAALNEEIRQRAEVEADELLEDIVIPEDTETPVDPAKALKEKAARRREQEKARKEAKQRKSNVKEAFAADTAQQRTYITDQGVEVFEDGTPVDGKAPKVVQSETPVQEATPVPVNRLDPNNGANLARLVLTVMENENISQEQAVKRVASLPSAKRKQYLEILDDGTMETVELTKEEREIESNNARLEEIGRAPQPQQTKVAFPEGLNSARIRYLKDVLDRDDAQRMYADGDQKADFIAGVFDGDRNAVKRFTARSLGRELPTEPTLEPTTTYEAATQTASAPQPVVGDEVTLGEPEDTYYGDSISTINIDGVPVGLRADYKEHTVQKLGGGNKTTPASTAYLIRVDGNTFDQMDEAGKDIYEDDSGLYAQFGTQEEAVAFSKTQPPKPTAPTSSKILSVSEDGTLATVEGQAKPVLTSKLKRSLKAASKTVSAKVAEKLAPNEQAEVSSGAKVFQTLATQDYVDNPDLTVAENVAARTETFYAKVPELAATLGVTEAELLVDGRQAELVGKIAGAVNPVEASTTAVVEGVQEPVKSLAKQLKDQGLTAEEAKWLARTKTEAGTIVDIQIAFGIMQDEAAGVVAIIQSLGLDVNNFVFQEDKATSGKRYIAKTQFIPQLAKALVTAGKQANTETAVHEVAHVARRFLLTKGFEGAIDTATIDAVESEYGVTDGKWTRPQEEQFAEHFVDFIKTGESPSEATDTLFQKMSNWIRKVTRHFTKQNQGVPENMQKIFAALMQRGKISETIDEQLAKLEKEVDQAREGRNKKQTSTAPRDENDVPFVSEAPIVQFRKEEAERILGRVMMVTEKGFFETVENARQKGLIDNALDTAKNVIADPERPITDEEFAGMAVMSVSIEERMSRLSPQIEEARRQAEENAKRGGEQRGGISSYLGKLTNQYAELEANQMLLATANTLSASTTSRSLGIRRLGINVLTLEPDTVIRNINNQRAKPMSSVTEAEIRQGLYGVKTKRDALRSAELSMARAKADKSILYMMKQGGKKLTEGEIAALKVRISQGLNSEGMTPEIALSMNSLANEYIKDGETTLDGLTEQLLSEFSEYGLMEQDAWYSIAGRFISPKAVTELQRTSKLLKQEAKLASQVFDAFEGVFDKVKDIPVATEAQERIARNVKNLTTKLKILQLFYEQNETNPEKRKLTLAAIEEAQKQLDVMLYPGKYSQETLDAENKVLQDTLKDLRGQIKDVDTKAKIDEALRTWSTPYVAKGTSFTSEARAKTKADLKQVRDMMRMHMVTGNPDETKLAGRLLDRLQKVEDSYEKIYTQLPSKKVMEPSQMIKDIQTRLSEAISAKGLQTRILNVQDLITNFSEEKYRAELKELELNPVLQKESDRIVNLRTELAALNKHLNSKMERAKTGTFKFWMREIMSINKAVLLSGDMPVLRQGSIVTSNPFRANFFDVTAKSARVYWSGLSKGTLTEQIISDITNSKHFTESIRHGMEYPDNSATLSDGESMVGSNVAEKIPIFGRLISGSNQAQAVGIMLARYQAYESYRIKFPNAPDAEMRAWADVVMTSTGKSTSAAINRASSFLDVFIISTKYAASRFETMIKPLKYARTQPRVAREALKDLLWFFGTRVALVGLLKTFMGDKVDMGSDVLKSTFMKIMVKNDDGTTRVYDPFAGISQPIRLVLGMPTKAIINMNGGDEKGTPIEDTLRYLRGRANPFMSMADGLTTGKDYFGRKTPRAEIAVRSYAPLPIQDLYDSIQASKDPFDISVSSFFNVMGVNSYFDKSRRIQK